MAKTNPDGQSPAGEAARREAIAAMHADFVAQFGAAMLVQARRAFVEHGRVALAVSFADMTAALGSGGEVRMLALPREQLRETVDRIDPARTGGVLQAVDYCDPANAAVLVLFDERGDFHHYTIVPQPPAAPPPVTPPPPEGA